MYKTETELAKPVIAWLESYQWDVYQEVQYRGKIADIIAVQGNLVWTIETKLVSTLRVIEQALEWKPYAHYVSVAVPATSRPWMFDRVLELFGIGKLTVGFEVHESVPPALNRKALSGGVLECLSPEHKTFAVAGNADGNRLTPFKRTCAKITEEIHRNPGITVKELIQRVKTHYETPASARACITKWLGTKHIDVRVETERKTLKLYPK